QFRPASHVALPFWITRARSDQIDADSAHSRETANPDEEDRRRGESSWPPPLRGRAVDAADSISSKFALANDTSSRRYTYLILAVKRPTRMRSLLIALEPRPRSASRRRGLRCGGGAFPRLFPRQSLF